jgi:2-dehydropantoate 2-reductase
MAHAIANTAGKYPSLTQDVMKKRATEIDTINGAIVREAEKLNVAVPVNATITRLIRILQATYAKQF